MKLTPEQIEETGEAAKAMLRGEVVQVFSEGRGWHDFEGFWLVGKNTIARRKPQPKLRAWKDVSEVPPNALIRAKGCFDNWTKILGVLGPNEVELVDGTPPVIVRNTLKHLFENDEHSTDGGKTWHPCGVLE